MRNDHAPPAAAPLTARLLGTLPVLLYAAAVPWLELDATHVFNPDWPPHARLHEVWQLATNCAIGLFALWRIWRQADVRLPALLCWMVLGGFLLAWLLQPGYGGSMQLGAGIPTRTLLGLDLGLVGAVLGLAAASLAMLVRTRGTL